MKRLHVNLAVTGLEAPVRFYASLFDAPPSVLKDDYAKWMLDDPRVNFAITTRGTHKGIDHLGIQVENEDELDEVYARLKMAGAPAIEQNETTCCYASSEKNWIFDPEGIPWETLLTRGPAPFTAAMKPILPRAVQPAAHGRTRQTHRPAYHAATVQI
jgi:predicted lactoylglutathione lyase